MLKTRIIPVLLLRENIIYKSKKFKNHRYIGDPLNTLKIFNEKEVDEIVILDTTATINQKSPNFELIKLLASEFENDAASHLLLRIDAAETASLSAFS